MSTGLGFIRYVTGDATALEFGGSSGRKYLCHIVNDAGFWGKGFVLAVGKRWPFVKTSYRRYWHEYKLGESQRVSVGGRVVVVNMFAQHGIKRAGGTPPIRYGPLRYALKNVGEYIARTGGRASVHMPRIGCGLAGGDWGEVEGIIRDELVEREVRVFVYDLPRKG